jgi:hypothetical protein
MALRVAASRGVAQALQLQLPAQPSFVHLKIDAHTTRCHPASLSTSYILKNFILCIDRRSNGDTR